MGLFDQLTSMAGNLGNLGNLAELMNNPQIKQMMNNPQIAGLIQKLDQDAIQKLIANVQKNGIPKDMASITKLIESLMKK